MDTFAEVVPLAGSNPRVAPVPSKVAARGGTSAPPPPALAASRHRPAHGGEAQVSVDPMAATDRYRLVMPYDQRL